MTLADIERQCHVLARTVLIVGEQLRTGGTPESIQYLDAPAFDGSRRRQFSCVNVPRT